MLISRLRAMLNLACGSVDSGKSRFQGWKASKKVVRFLRVMLFMYEYLSSFLKRGIPYTYGINVEIYQRFAAGP